MAKKDSVPSKDAKLLAVLIGEGRAGKTSLFLRLVKNQFLDQPVAYMPSVCEPMSFDVEFPELPNAEKSVQKRKEEAIEVTLMDSMSRTHDCDGLSAFLFTPRNPAVVFICFSVVRHDGETAMDALDQWVDMAKHHFDKGTKFVLVGCQIDLRETTTPSPRVELMFPDQGHKMAETIGAVDYIECSAKTGEGIDTIRDEISNSWLWSPKSRWSLRWESLKGQCVVC